MNLAGLKQSYLTGARREILPGVFFQLTALDCPAYQARLEELSFQYRKEHGLEPKDSLPTTATLRLMRLAMPGTVVHGWEEGVLEDDDGPILAHDADGKLREDVVAEVLSLPPILDGVLDAASQLSADGRKQFEGARKNSSRRSSGSSAGARSSKAS